MTASNLVENSYQNVNFNTLLQWLFAIIIGTAITLVIYVLLPALNYKEPVNPPPIVELEFLPWQKLPPPIEKPKPVKKSVQKPQPVVKPKPIITPKPAVKPKPVEKPTPRQVIQAEPEFAPMPVIEPEPPIVDPIPESVVEAPAAPIVEPSPEATEEPLPIPVPIFQLSNLPRFIHKVKPEYPPELKLQGISGNVKLSVLIDATGKVRDIEVIQSSHPEFASAAIAAIKDSSFQPAEIDGRPVPTRYKIPFSFRLQ